MRGAASSKVVELEASASGRRAGFRLRRKTNFAMLSEVSLAVFGETFFERRSLTRLAELFFFFFFFWAMTYSLCTLKNRGFAVEREF